MTCHIITRVPPAPPINIFAVKELPIYQISRVPVPSSYFDCATNTYRSIYGGQVYPGPVQQYYTITLLAG